MRKRTVRNGMRLVMAALIIIIMASFYHSNLSELFSLSSVTENRIYTLAMFLASAMGGYGAILVVFGFVLSSQRRDNSVRILPTFLVISGLIALFFYLLTTSINGPVKHDKKRLRPGETITI